MMVPVRGRTLSVLLGTLALCSACDKGPVASHTTLTENFASLRAAFNADSGKVRAILLASPT